MSAEVQTPAEMRAAAREKRHEFSRSKPGVFSRVMLAAMELFRKMREAGVSFEDGVKGIEAEMRGSWPGHTSKFTLCAGCDGTGYRETWCTQQMRCARPNHAHAEAEYSHPYVVPCECADGDRMRGRSSVPAEEQLAAVGRRKKPQPKGWSRSGM